MLEKIMSVEGNHVTYIGVEPRLIPYFTGTPQILTRAGLNVNKRKVMKEDLQEYNGKGATAKLSTSTAGQTTLPLRRSRPLPRLSSLL